MPSTLGCNKLDHHLKYDFSLIMFGRLLPLGNVILSKANTGPVLASAAIAVEVIDSQLQKSQPLHPLQVKFVVFVAFFIVNLISVSWPGRLDGEAYDDKTGKLSPLTPKTGTSLFTPSGWAFSIWGLIYTLELISVSIILFTTPTKILQTTTRSLFSFTPTTTVSSVPYMPFNTYRKICPSLLKASYYQALWCAAFRSKFFEQKSYSMWLSPLFLGLCARNLFAISTIVSTDRAALTGWQFALFFFGFAIHAGWVTAATLVNLNGSWAYSEGLTKKSTNKKWVRRLLGHGSVLLACALALGSCCAYDKLGVTFSATLCWALAAVQSGMRERCESNIKDVEGVKDQLLLARGGKFFCGVVSALKMLSLSAA